MKNQYVGDIGDFAKYYLLRQLAGCELEKGKKTIIGVNWYLNNGGDGCLTDYLDNPNGVEANTDKDLFAALGFLVKREIRKVQSIKELNLIPGAIYFDEPVKKDNDDERKGWFGRGLEKLKGADILFFDPDNGMKSEKAKTFEKYVLYEEVKRVWAEKDFENTSLILYQHQNRRTNMLSKIKDKLKECGINEDCIYVLQQEKRFFIIIQRERHKIKIADCLNDIEYKGLSQYKEKKKK
jgi:L-rhamnose mutarotase